MWEKKVRATLYRTGVAGKPGRRTAIRCTGQLDNPVTRAEYAKAIPRHTFRREKEHIMSVNQYVEREEKRKALRQDATNAWKEYQSTGMHIGAQEVTAWLETWGEADEQSAPVVQGSDREQARKYLLERVKGIEPSS